jgi:hypothetical protein
MWPLTIGETWSANIRDRRAAAVRSDPTPLFLTDGLILKISTCAKWRFLDTTWRLPQTSSSVLRVVPIAPVAGRPRSLAGLRLLLGQRLDLAKATAPKAAYPSTPLLLGYWIPPVNLS